MKTKPKKKPAVRRKDQCEGCTNKATHWDCEGTPLCKTCYDELEESTRASPKAVEPMVRRVNAITGVVPEKGHYIADRDLPRIVEAMAKALHYSDDYELSYRQQAIRVLRAIGVEVT